MANAKRRSFLERLGIGKGVAEEVDASLTQLQRALDKQGIQRKAFGDKEKGVLEDMAAEVDGALEGLTDDVELRNKVIAIVMGHIATLGGSDEAPEAEEVEVMEDSEEEDDELVTQVMSLSAQVKALTEENNALVEGFKDMLPEFVKGVKAMSELAPLVKEAGKISDLTSRIAKIEKAVSGRPRRASLDASTEIAPSEEIVKDIEKGTAAEQKTVLGVPVTLEVSYDR